uniref:Protein kinase domain protein n=1 Tax=Toxoplasma gondii COUG TaxID=1074873 RepID=A0A2G8XUL5_TOXGO|nr:protein kinase domain protein [Toxoplasma gondii COUG]
MFGRMGRFVGGARRAVGRGWRRFTTGDASAFDDQAKKIVRLGATVQLIQLLAALHTRKVVHGKLEPKSVLLFSHGLLYLSDLGRARRHGERFTTSRPSRYGAPEVLEHPETPYTYSRDAYSLGIILFELWCGRLPFDLGTPGVDSSEKLENSHPATLYQTVRNLDQRLSFDVCPSDMPESVKTLIRKFLTRRRWTAWCHKLPCATPISAAPCSCFRRPFKGMVKPKFNA